MAIGKPRGKNGARPVFVYDPRIGRKVYVGSCVKLRGEGGAEELERQKKDEFARAVRREAEQAETAEVEGVGYTVRAWADEWLEDYHGAGTSRPERGTYHTNKGCLKAYVEKFGDRLLDTETGGVSRPEALAFAKTHGWAAKTVSAMYATAVDAGHIRDNPMANRRLPARRERKFIQPITEQETDRLAEIARDEWGREGYGLVARALVLFGAWVGSRPGETTSVELNNMDFDAGRVTLRRVKKRGRDYPTDTIVLPRVAIDALEDAMPYLATEGPAFRTIDGSAFSNGNLSYYWRPIRARFRETVDDRRWQELLDGGEGGRHFDFYALRHRVASHIVKMGGNEFDVANQLGNSPRVCRDTYIHDDVEHRNARNQGFLTSSKVVDLEARRDRRGA